MYRSASHRDQLPQRVEGVSVGSTGVAPRRLLVFDSGVL